MGIFSFWLCKTLSSTFLSDQSFHFIQFNLISRIDFEVLWFLCVSHIDFFLFQYKLFLTFSIFFVRFFFNWSFFYFSLSSVDDLVAPIFLLVILASRVSSMFSSELEVLCRFHVFSSTPHGWFSSSHWFSIVFVSCEISIRFLQNFNVVLEIFLENLEDYDFSFHEFFSKDPKFHQFSFEIPLYWYWDDLWVSFDVGHNSFLHTLNHLTLNLCINFLKSFFLIPIQIAFETLLESLESLEVNFQCG